MIATLALAAATIGAASFTILRKDGTTGKRKNKK